VFDFAKAGWRHLKEQDLETQGKTLQTWVNNNGFRVELEAGIKSYYCPGPVEPVGDMAPPDPKKTWGGGD